MILTIVLGAALLFCLGLLLSQYSGKLFKSSDKKTDEVKISRDLAVTLSHRSDYIQDMHLASHFNVNLVNITRDDSYIQDIIFRFNKIPIGDFAYDEERQLLIIDDSKVITETVSIPQGMKTDLKFSKFFKLYSNESIDFKYVLVCKALSRILKRFNVDEHSLLSYLYFIDIIVVMEDGSIVKSNKIDLRSVVNNIHRVASLDLHHSVDVFKRMESDKPYVKPTSNGEISLNPYQSEVENYLNLHIPSKEPKKTFNIDDVLSKLKDSKPTDTSNEVNNDNPNSDLDD